ncbi:MAG: glutamate--tRNA ligase [Christensenellaceae bacterium]|nr:glutamate--tRNA ligase [Christensenellaceae bacterium]
MTVRTRFAPSPTGYLHLGGLRTALYCYLFAKQNKGKFILRIEDTDQEREVDGAIEMIYSSMRAAGLHYDEGPDVGGEYGPYIQTERKDIYLPYAMQLIESGHAYPCFCTVEELAERREAAAENGITFKYDKKCASIPKDEAKKRMASGEPYVIRQNMPIEGSSSYEDVLFGTVEVPNNELDDNVLIKQNGMPTYNFANVIDDHLMAITHVMRGSEYISSTPKYNLLYDAFGWERPIYIHLPVVMKDATRKLSKRYGDPSFEDLLDMGYVKDAIINFIALLGWNPGDNREFFTLDELVEAFSLEGLSKSPSIFNMDKLKWFNFEYIRNMPFANYLKQATPWFDKELQGKNIDYKRLAELTQTRTEVFNQLPEMIDFLAELPEYDIAFYTHKKMKTNSEISLTILKELIPVMEGIDDWSENTIHETLVNFIAEKGCKNGLVYWPLRIAMSGKLNTPGGAIEIAYLLGKNETLKRMNIGIDKLEN